VLAWLGFEPGPGHDVEDLRDPRQALDLAYARQIELLGRARRAVADVVTARKRLELQARQLRPRLARLDGEATAAVERGEREAAAEALTWREALNAELAELDRQTGELAGEETRLRRVVGGLDLRVQQLRVRRDALLAGYEAARARAEVGQVLADVRTRDAELLQAVQDAEDRVARTRVMADALHGRAARGALGPPAPVSDDVTRREEELLWGPAAEEERRRARDEGGE
jgi:phage shock protein A